MPYLPQLLVFFIPSISQLFQASKCNWGGGGVDRYGGGEDRYGGGEDRYGGGEDRYGGGVDRCGGGVDRYGVE